MTRRDRSVIAVVIALAVLFFVVVVVVVVVDVDVVGDGDGSDHAARRDRADATAPVEPGADQADHVAARARAAARPDGGAPARREPDPRTDPGPGAEHVARYDGRSGRLSPHASVHGTSGNAPTRSHAGVPDLIVTVDSRIAIPDVPISFEARVIGRGEDEVVPDAITLTIAGAERPMERGERAWRASYVPTLAAHPAPPDGTPPRVEYLVRATGTFEGEAYSRSASGWALLHTPGAHMDAARAAVAREGTDVVVRIPVRVERAGAYYGYAELWGGEDGLSPIAFARDRVEWEPGDRELVLLFGGAVIRERGLDGPYVVRNARFMQVDTLPPHEERPVEEVATTPAWPAASFE